MYNYKLLLGFYQLKQAYSYLGEHINNGKIEIRVNKECLNFKNSKILFSIIKSRHSSSTKYRVFCKYSPYSDTVDGIESWYCTCKAGMRTVGCCSHIATIIYYLSYGKYLDHIPNPSSRLTSIFPLSDYNSSNKNKKTNEANKKVNKKINSCSDHFSSVSDGSSH
jgi:hypothetical protein